MNMKQTKTNTAVELSIGATILFGLAVLAIKAKWPEVWSPVFWITPAFFYLYEVVFMWLLGRYGSYSRLHTLFRRIRCRELEDPHFYLGHRSSL